MCRPPSNSVVRKSSTITLTLVPLLRRQAAYLGVVMQAGALGGKDVIALGRPDPPHLVGGDAHADAGAAYQNAAVELAPGDSLGHLHGDIRVIDRFFRIAAEVVISVPCFGNYLMITSLSEHNPGGRCR